MCQCVFYKEKNAPPPVPGYKLITRTLTHTPLPTNPPVAIEQSFLNPRMITIKCTCIFICQPPTYAGSRRLYIPIQYMQLRRKLVYIHCSYLSHLCDHRFEYKLNIKYQYTFYFHIFIFLNLFIYLCVVKIHFWNDQLE